MLTQNDLKQFTGTTCYYRHWLRRFVCTEGVQHVAEVGKAYWLLDAIASHQPEVLKDAMLQEIQFWKLRVNVDQTAQLTCERNTVDVVVMM